MIPVPVIIHNHYFCARLLYPTAFLSNVVTYRFLPAKVNLFRRNAIGHSRYDNEVLHYFFKEEHRFHGYLRRNSICLIFDQKASRVVCTLRSLRSSFCGVATHFGKESISKRSDFFYAFRSFFSSYNEEFSQLLKTIKGL